VEVPAIAAVRSIPTSVGEIAGVPDAIRLVLDGIARRAKWVIRSDIPEFFTKIPRGQVFAFLRTHIADPDFLSLFEAAVATTLENTEALGALADLFPLGDIGVAQGSALSPLIGNIVLAEFDKAMNDPEIMCKRNFCSRRYCLSGPPAFPNHIVSDWADGDASSHRSNAGLPKALCSEASARGDAGHHQKLTSHKAA
jgi:hypothetical protein